MIAFQYQIPHFQTNSKTYDIFLCSSSHYVEHGKNIQKAHSNSNEFNTTQVVCFMTQHYFVYYFVVWLILHAGIQADMYRQSKTCSVTQISVNVSRVIVYSM